MNNTHIKALVGGLAAAATLLAFSPFGVANAAETPITIDPMDPASRVATLTIEGKGSAIKGHSFTALRLGVYMSASKNGDNELTSVSTSSKNADSTGPADEHILPAMKDAYLAASGASALPTGYEDNVIGAVSKNWLGYVSAINTSNEDTTSNSRAKAYDGKLRQFVTNLSGNANVKKRMADTTRDDVSTVVGPTSGADTDDMTAQFTGLKGGIYLVVDTTASLSGSSPASIPMLVGTQVTSKDGQSIYDTFANDAANKLGVIKMKSATPTVEKRLIKPSNGAAGIGDELTYQIIASIPLTTGFSHYKYVLTDQPSAGLTYEPDETTVEISNSEIFDTAGSQAVDVPAPTGYEVTPAVGSTPTSGQAITFNLSKVIRLISQGDGTSAHPQYFGSHFIKITYKMRVDDQAVAGNVHNGVKLAYSNDTQKQPDNDNGDDNTAPNPPASEGVIDHTNDPNDPNQPKVYFYNFGIVDQARNNHSTKLDDATFQIKDSDGKIIKFYPVKDENGKVIKGSYKKAADQRDSNTEAITSLRRASAPNDAVNGSLTDGQLRFDGLAAGVYTVEETDPPTGYSEISKSTFTVTIDTDAPYSAAAPHYKNGGDVFDLVEANETGWTHAQNPTHFIEVNEVNSISQLPMTGGAGAILIGLVVVVLLAGAGSIYIYTRRSEKTLDNES
ncbi:isopeptide-forming domain-containing fimbrial protein [Bifidobacterium sp. ESL0800]|uniref:isopeptide-forming domain-containing fimbrial protein n=1 Tax=Bifidobacterium sp. ESL0800 TaxID=2983236 RepID=UPI0023F85D03|nr:isopeptide-forming domain-containing fimbrial protein [Bifidobacterium sp. ESL0800]WEV76427.1 isopeptide-forming domain-containing fimbrial protein [Bifidobacterium sp. ESL0800]